MEIVDKISKVVKFAFAAGSCSHYVVDATLVEVRFGSWILKENLFLDVTDEQTGVVMTKLAFHSDTSRLLVVTALKMRLLSVRTSSARRTKVCVGGSTTDCLFKRCCKATRPSLLGITVYSDLMSIVKTKRLELEVG